MVKSSNRALFQIPDYLTAFKSYCYNDTKSIARSIIDGTFDEKADEDKLNMIIYSTLTKWEKPFFKAFFLKHVDQKVLDGEAPLNNKDDDEIVYNEDLEQSETIDYDESESQPTLKIEITPNLPTINIQQIYSRQTLDKQH